MFFENGLCFGQGFELVNRMNRVIAVCNSSGYMTVAGMFLGVNAVIYETIKNKNEHIVLHSLVLGGTFGAVVGAYVPVAIPVYIVSIPCYIVMKYLAKNKLI